MCEKELDEMTVVLEIERAYTARLPLLRQKITEFVNEQDPEWVKSRKREYLQNKLAELDTQILAIQQLVHKVGPIPKIMLRTQYDNLIQKEKKIKFSLEKKNTNGQDFAEKICQAKMRSIWDFLGVQETKRNIRCPFHEDRTPSCHIYENGQHFYCFSCNEHGDVIDFYMKLNNCNFQEAIKALT